MRKFLTRTLLVSALAISGLAVNSAASPASAATCSGTKIDSLTFTSSNTNLAVANVGVYRNGSSVCAIAVKTGVLYGESSWMDLWVGGKRDAGYFLYYAGPLTVTDNGCTYVTLAMKNRANEVIVDGPVIPKCY